MPNDQESINEHLIRHHSNYELAKFTVYTKDKTPDEKEAGLVTFCDYR